MELDGDEVAIMYIKDVTFSVNRPDAYVIKMTKVNMQFSSIVRLSFSVRLMIT